MSAAIAPTVLLLRSSCLSTLAGQYEEVMERAEKDGWSRSATSGWSRNSKSPTDSTC